MNDNASIQCLSIAPGLKNLLERLNLLQITAKRRSLSS